MGYRKLRGFHHSKLWLPQANFNYPTHDLTHFLITFPSVFFALLMCAAEISRLNIVTYLYHAHVRENHISFTFNVQ